MVRLSGIICVISIISTSVLETAPLGGIVIVGFGAPPETAAGAVGGRGGPSGDLERLEEPPK